MSLLLIFKVKISIIAQQVERLVWLFLCLSLNKLFISLHNLQYIQLSKFLLLLLLKLLRLLIRFSSLLTKITHCNRQPKSLIIIWRRRPKIRNLSRILTKQSSDSHSLLILLIFTRRDILQELLYNHLRLCPCMLTLIPLRSVIIRRARRVQSKRIFENLAFFNARLLLFSLVSAQLRV